MICVAMLGRAVRHLLHLLHLLQLFIFGLQMTLYCRMSIGLLLAVAIGCGGQQARTVISLQNINCASCGSQSVEALTASGGVHQASFDGKKVELEIAYDPGEQTPETLRKVVAGLGYDAVIGGGKGSYEAAAKLPPDADIQTINTPPESLDLKALCVSGKVTVIDFFAVWCGPCREVDRAMKEVLSTTKGKGVAYRRIDIGTWDSPIAKKFLGKIPELPYVLVFDKQSKLIKKISGLNLVELRRSIQRGLAD
jgi:thiol-disulfide isomerase/thioredoxin